MLLQFEPWAPCKISTLFWRELAFKKLNEFGTGRVEANLKAFYLSETGKSSSSLFFSTESFDFNQETLTVAELGSKFNHLPGRLLLCDTIEEFKSLDRAQEALKLAKENASCQDLDDIRYFLLLVFADVKKFKFYYQIIYPVQIFESEQLQYEILHETKLSFTDVKNAISVDSIERKIRFKDSSSVNNIPGWPLRQVLVNLSQKYPGECFEVLCGRSIENGSSLSFKVKLPLNNKLSQVSGWEISLKDPTKVAPVRTVDISALIDPIQLARQAGELNLKLMKWRLIPDLDLEVLKNTSCLLIGSGTLGCNILRLILGWGFKTITLVDNGKVSYSNPVRQSLFTFEDAKVSASKAKTAAIRAQQIDPTTNIEGFDISVSMPGHAIIDEEESKKDFDALKDLVSTHDVIFLLTDSRESRWLPALLGHSLKKIVITAGLGFDSFVVMRHGIRDSIDKSSCYFCHDIIGPSDSLSGRSLDQQCTVTRPGLSYIASAFAVELLVSCLQHVKGGSASASDLSRLGKLPHQIRGNLAHQEVFTLSGSAFENCTCCSETILQCFEKDSIGSGFEFVKMACNSPLELERLSGLVAIKLASEELANLSMIEPDENDDSDDF